MTEKITVERWLPQWKTRLDSVVEFVADHGRLPSVESSEESERFLGQWITNQKSKSKLGTLTPTRVALLDERLPLWREVRRTRMNWEQALDAAADFISANGRFPEAARSDEAFLAEWLTRQREKSRRPLSAERIALLDEKLPVWRNNSQKRLWDEQLHDAVSLYQKAGRLPFNSNLFPEEQKSGEWIRRQNKRLARGTISEEEVRNLNAKLPHWDRLPDTNWEAPIEATRIFTREHGRLPSAASSEQPEKRLGDFVLRALRSERAGELPHDHSEAIRVMLPEWKALPNYPSGLVYP